MALLRELREVMGRFQADAPFAVVEEWEREAKALIAEIAAAGRAGAAREVAEIIRDAGFLTKCKPYAIKAAHPFGYSIFLQNAGEGFSFQRHVEHKVETFHILAAHAGAMVFLCPYSEWLDFYSAGRLDAWLAGAADDELARYATIPRPGDVYHVAELSVVHTVLGCDLEEFANTSIDMVDRLHDQNAGVPIPPRFTREYMKLRLRAISPPARSHEVVGGVRRPLEPVEHGPCEITTLASGAIRAARGRVQPGATTPPFASGDRAVSIHVWSGTATLLLGDGDAVTLSRGDITAVLPGLDYRLRSESYEELVWSEQRVPLAHALT